MPIHKPSRRWGIYLIPNLLTVTALFFGYYAIIAAQQDKFIISSMAIYAAMLMDGFDGRVARLMHTESLFGKELDSLSDMISFGAAPALVFYSWSLSSLGRLGWTASFIYAVAVALRLARFNTQAGKVGNRYFQGLSCTAAAGFLAGLVWVGSQLGWQVNDGNWGAGVIAGVMVIIALLCVSSIRYRSFKEWEDVTQVPFRALVVFVFILVLLGIDPAKTLFSSFCLYALSGPVLTIKAVCQKRFTRQSLAANEE